MRFLLSLRGIRARYSDVRRGGSVEFLRDTGDRPKNEHHAENSLSLSLSLSIDGLAFCKGESRRRRMPPPPLRTTGSLVASLLLCKQGIKPSERGPQISPLAGGGVTRNRPERFHDPAVAKMHAHHSRRITTDEWSTRDTRIFRARELRSRFFLFSLRSRPPPPAKWAPGFLVLLLLVISCQSRALRVPRRRFVITISIEGIVGTLEQFCKSWYVQIRGIARGRFLSRRFVRKFLKIRNIFKFSVAQLRAL